jgi:hypothetical protein
MVLRGDRNRDCVGRRVTATVEKYVGGQKSRQEPTMAAPYQELSN